MYKRRRSDKPVTDRTKVWHMKSCATQCNSDIDSQDAAIEGGQDVAVQPFPKNGSLRWITSFGQ